MGCILIRKINGIKVSIQIFENSEFWVLSISKFSLFGTMFHQFQKLRPVSEATFTLEFRFSYKKFLTSLLRNPIFKASEAQR